MSILYERLYLSGNFRDVSIARLLPELIDRILENFPGPRELRVEKRIEDVRLQAKHLQSFGIIVNELLTNAMKYAFVGRTAGRISVSAYPLGAVLHLEVSDDGVGMPEEVGFGKGSGFGLLLVENLTSQMRGTVSILRSGGTTYRFEFPLPADQVPGSKPSG